MKKLFASKARVADAAGRRFSAAFAEAFGPRRPALPKRRGHRPRVPLAKVLPALVFHGMNAAGTFAQHFTQLFADDSLADSSLSERRTRLPREVFTELTRLGLPRRLSGQAAGRSGWHAVQPAPHAANQSHGAQGQKPSRSRCLCQAHHPGAARTGAARSAGRAIGRGGQSEWALALELLAQLPARALLLARALLACERARAAARVTPVLRVSCIKTLERMRAWWLTLAPRGDVLSAQQKQQLTEKFPAFAGRWCVTRRRKPPRSCLRAVRQPVRGGPGCAASHRGQARCISKPFDHDFPKGIKANPHFSNGHAAAVACRLAAPL